MTTTTHPYQGRRALIVDDDPDLLLQMKFNLESLGFEVQSAEGQEAAENLIPGLKADIAILDLMMEHEDSGFILAWRLRKSFPKLPVVMVTAVSGRTGIDFDAATRDERSWVHADAVLTKPIRFEQLVKEINRLVPMA